MTRGFIPLGKTLKTEGPILTAYKLELDFTSLLGAAFYSAESRSSEWNFLQGKVHITASTELVGPQPYRELHLSLNCNVLPEIWVGEGGMDHL